MKIFIDLVNNKTIKVNDNELSEHVRFGQFWATLVYKNKTQVHIPNIQIAEIRRE